MAEISRRKWIGIAVVLAIVAAVFVSKGLLYENIWLPHRAEQELAELNEMYPDIAMEKNLAEAYWSQYPDAAADFYFGRRGLMGVYGARAHFRTHGESEGRIWPQQ